MHLIDWLLVVVCMLGIVSVAVYTHLYMKSVSDFLSGGRFAGRYLLAVAKGELAAGAIVFVAGFEAISKSGFTLTWWGPLSTPITLVVLVSGFVIYRYRETRAMTLAQFFEIRYSKSFRVFTGMLGFVAGLLNFGIFPAVGARFLVYYLEFPATLHIFSVAVPTYIPLMAVLLAITLFVALSGGMITLMVTNCLEGMISQVLYLVLIFGLMWMFSWHDIMDVMRNRPAGQSLLNPFDSSHIKDFNIWYVLMTVAVNVYGTMAWQNQSGYNAAALSAHESRMGNIVGRWRELGKGPVALLLGICAMTYLYSPHFVTQAAAVQTEIAQISQPQIQQQMLLPVAVSHMLPAGLKGAFCVILLLGIFGGDGTPLLSWSSLFIQDVLIPLRQKPLTPQEHIKWLRWSAIGVAFFAFFFGILFRQTEYIFMWWSLTMAVFVGGAGSAIIGGLYWKKGTTAGAWTAMIVGSGLALGGIIAREIYGDAFPLNGVEISFFSSLIAIAIYAITSLLTCKEDFNMDRMLHRNRYAIEGQAPSRATKWTFASIIGIDENFTMADKWIAGSLFAWTLIWFGVFSVGTIWNLIAPWPDSTWSTYWYIAAIEIPIFLAVIGTVWFTWGGLRDMSALFRQLRQEKVNVLDNGMVVNHQNLSEIARKDIPNSTGNIR